MKMYNTSMEGFKCQCDSKVFVFKPRESTEVPESLTGFLYERYKDSGIFIILPEDTPLQVKKKARDALLSYLHGALRERIINFNAEADEARRRGATLPKSSLFERALRWDKEIRIKLEVEAPIERELSFLSEEERKKIGMVVPELEYIDQNLFNPTRVAEGKKEYDEVSARQHGKDQEAAIEEALSGPVTKPVTILKKRGAPKGGWKKKSDPLEQEEVADPTEI